MRRCVVAIAIQGLCLAACGAADRPPTPPMRRTVPPAPEPAAAVAVDPVASVASTPEELVDTDGDRIADAWDSCENDPEIWNGLHDDDGCPDPADLSRAVAMPAFQRLVAVSPNQAYEAHIDKSDAGPAWIVVRERATARLVVRTRAANRFAPRAVLIDDTARVATLDEYFRPAAEHMIVIYAPDGRVVADLAAERALSADELARSRASGPPHRWRSDVTPPALVGDTLRVPTAWGTAVEIDLGSGWRRSGGHLTALPTREQRLEQYLAGQRTFDAIHIGVYHRAAEGLVCWIHDTRTTCDAQSSARPAGPEVTAHARAELVAALRSATAFARCVVREEIKGTSLGAFDAGLALLDITEAGTSYRYYIRADRDPECLKALHRIQGFATPAAQRPALAR